MSHLTIDFDDELLTPKQVAEFFKFAPQSLADMRSDGTGPEFIKLGPNRSSPVRYPRRAVLAWIAEHNQAEA